MPSCWPDITLPHKMTDREIAEMQQKIDIGIRLAQERLVERARLFNATLVVARGGKVVELTPDELYPEM